MSHKTMFIDAPLVKEKKGLGGSIQVVNGDQFARLIDAAIIEKEKEGYTLISSMPIHSSNIHMSSFAYGYTAGALLIFKKKEA
jgi:hypothetical protein